MTSKTRLLLNAAKSEKGRKKANSNKDNVHRTPKTHLFLTFLPIFAARLPNIFKFFAFIGSLRRFF